MSHKIPLFLELRIMPVQSKFPLQQAYAVSITHMKQFHGYNPTTHTHMKINVYMTL